MRCWSRSWPSCASARSLFWAPASPNASPRPAVRSTDSTASPARLVALEFELPGADTDQHTVVVHDRDVFDALFEHPVHDRDREIGGGDGDHVAARVVDRWIAV